MTRAARKGKRVDERTLVAYHEAGHAVLSAAINDMPEHVSIRPDAATLGRTRQRMFARPTSLVQVHVAGFAAEHVLTGRRARQFDREVGFALISRSDPELRAAFEGIEDQDGFKAVRDVLRFGCPDSDDDIKAEVERLYEAARASLSAVWPAVKAVAEAILQEEELDRAGVDRALAGVDIYAPVIDVQRVLGLLPAPVR